MAAKEGGMRETIMNLVSLKVVFEYTAGQAQYKTLKR